VGLQFPSALDAFEFVVGADWPEADEDALRRCGEAWLLAAAQLRQVLPDAGLAGARVLQAVDGAVAGNFDQLWSQFTEEGGYLPALAAICDELARACDTAALEVEYAKYQCIFAAIALAVSVAWMAAAWFTGAAAGIPFAIAATQITVRIIAMRLLQGILLGAVSNVAIDLAAQVAQAIEGHRHEWDHAKTRRAAEDGGIYGAVGAGVFLAGARVATGAMSTWQGKVGALGITGVVGGAAAPLSHGEMPTGNDVLMALTSGLAGGLGPDLVRGHTHGSDPLGAPEVDPSRLDLSALADGLVRASEGGRLFDGGNFRLPDDDSLATGGSESRVDIVRHRPDDVRPDLAVREPRPEVWSQDPAKQEPPAGSGVHAPVRDTDIGGLAGVAAPDVGIVPAARSDGSTPLADAGTRPDGPVRETTPAAMGQDRGGVPASRVELLAPPHPPPSAGPPAAGPPPAGPPSAGTPGVSTGSPGGAVLPGAAVLGVGTAAPWAAGVPDAGLGLGPSGDVGRPRGAPLADLPSWSDGDGNSLNAEQNHAAGALLDRARLAEVRLTATVREIASEVGGELFGEADRLKTADSLKRKLADRLADGVPLSVAIAQLKDSVRYTVGLSEDGYSSGTGQTIRSLLDRGFRPVDFKNHWEGGSGYRGVNTFWLDPLTGQVFEVQFHTDNSFRAKTSTHGLLAEFRVMPPDDPRRMLLEAEHLAGFVDVRTPEGAGDIGLPEGASLSDPVGDLPEDPGAREPIDVRVGDLDRWELTDQEAVDLARANLVVTDAGLAFYAPDDNIRDFAKAIHPTDGFVTIDLHGWPKGFEIDGYLLSPEQFAGALRDLRDDGLLDLPEGGRIKLISCDTAVGGVESPAALLARELGVLVVAPDSPVWTAMDGDEVVATAVLIDGRWQPADPPDGHWHVFTPDGGEATL